MRLGQADRRSPEESVKGSGSKEMRAPETRELFTRRASNLQSVIQPYMAAPIGALDDTSN